jgi:hypothetical protein
MIGAFSMSLRPSLVHESSGVSIAAPADEKSSAVPPLEKSGSPSGALSGKRSPLRERSSGVPYWAKFAAI